MDDRQRRFAILVALLFVYAVVLIATGGLGFEPRRDEAVFWETTQRFAAAGGISLEALRSYDQGMTPLAFLSWAGLERLFGGGIQVGRALNLVCSFAMVCAVALPRAGEGWRPALAALGLLAFPYFLGVGTHLYTDGIAAALVLAGVIAWQRARWVLSAAALAAAIATRQFAVAAPLALLMHELAQRGVAPVRAAWVAPLAAATTLLGWIAFFGGLAPADGIAIYRMHNAELLRITPQYALYFLVCIGAYYAIPELVLLRRRAPFAWPAARTSAAIVAAMIGLFVVFPPLENLDYPIPAMGYLDRAARFMLSDAPRMVLFCTLGSLAVLRFAQPGLTSAFVLTNTLIMLKAQVGWDKYALLLLPVLWYLAAHGETRAQDAPALESRTRRDA